jgi:HAMP domain-containing protein
MNFSLKLSIFLLVLIITTGALVSFIAYQISSKTLESRMVHSLEEQFALKMELIDRNLSERKSDIKAFASDPIVSSRNSTPMQITKRMIEFRNAYNRYVSLSFFDLNRVRIADTSGLDVGEQHLFISYWKNPAIDKVFCMHVSKSLSIEQIVIYFSYPVKDDNGKTFGVIVSRMLIARLYGMTKNPVNYQLELLKIDLVNREGLLLYSNYNRNGIMRDSLAQWDGVKRSLAGEKSGSGKHVKHPEEEEEEEESIYVFSSEQGYLDFKGNNWTLIAHIPSKVVLAPAAKLRNSLIIALTIIMGLVFLAGLFFSRKFIKPLEQLAKSAEIIGTGDLEHKISIKSGDEIEKLATAFNEMVESLKKTTSSRDELTKEIHQRKQAQDEILKLNEDLEITVAKKTAELNKKIEKSEKTRKAMLYMIEDLNTTSKDLENKTSEVELTNKELLSQTEELNRVVRLMTGRELRMMELKENIKKLCAQLEAAGMTPVAGDQITQNQNQQDESV